MDLEELIKNFNQEPSIETQNAFLAGLKTSQLFLTVSIGENMLEEIKKSEVGKVNTFENEVGFSINYLKGEGDKKAVPLFTREELMEQTSIRSSLIALPMARLAEMLKESGEYSDIIINPFTDMEIGMPVNSFLNLFNAKKPGKNFNKLTEMILDLLKNSSIELEKETVFFARGNEDNMKNGAVDGVFRPRIPFNVSSRDDAEDLEYLNILIMPESKKILDIGDELSQYFLDIFIAPGSEFEFVEDVDEFTSVWRCVNQPFYDD